MDIKRGNYEIWAIDYLEGKLSTSQSAVFMVFLAENADLADELDQIRDAEVAPNHKTPITDFSHLKKDYTSISITPDCFEEFCIAYHEGDLDISIRKNLFDYIGSDSNKIKLFETYKLLKVQPNKQILFKNKKELKKPTGIFVSINSRNILQLVSTLAACILIFIILRYNNLNSFNSIITSINKSELSIVNSIPNSKISLNNKSYESVNKPNKNFKLITEVRNNSVDTSKIILLSAVDTSCWQDPFIPATRIDISKIPNVISNPGLIINLPEEKIYYADVKQSFTRKTLNNILYQSQLIFTKPGKLTLDALLRRSVKGINQVAETELHYNSEVDDEGKIIAFALSSERFNITKKVKSN